MFPRLARYLSLPLEGGGPLAVEGVLIHPRKFYKNSLSLAYARQLPREGALMLAKARVIL